ncbi:hypothetical protein ACIQVE_01580 [Pseudomonas sp. NPDC098747]|uniref:hypothetical protein n=1 Tax=Pseudomonas sp. NPDC098747 TaxID=3364487 RepID=UPI00383B9B3F
MRLISPLLGLGVVCLSSFANAAPSSSPLSAPIIGRVPTATAPVITNVTVPGKNPAQGDVLKGTYTYADPDNDLVDPTRSVFSWSAAGAAISGATVETFTPTAAQNKKFLSFAVTPASLPPADPSKATTPVTSPNSAAPVLPPRSQLTNEFIKSPSSQSWGDAYKYCAIQNERLPSVAELQTLFTTYTRANAAGESSQNDIGNTYGWSGGNHWTTQPNGEDRHVRVHLSDDGRALSDFNGSEYVFACIKAGAAEGLPTVTGITIPNAAVGTRVTAAYTYNGNATIPDRSRFQWYTATATNGSGKVLATGAGATTKTYTPVAADAGKYLMVEITPASYDTVAGTMVSKVGTQIVSILTITGLTIEKPTATRASFQANHTVTGGTEADLTYQWYWKGAAINGATAKTFEFWTLTIPSASAAEELKVEVSKRPAIADRRNRMVEEKAALATATLGLRSSIAWNAPFDQGTWYDMAKTCASQSNGNKRPGTTAELQALVASLGNMSAYGVNTSNSYWTGTRGATLGTHQIVHLGKGEMSNSYADTGTGGRGLCVNGTAAAAPAVGNKWANGHSFSESNFPTTGFNGAYFEFEGLNGRQDFTYVSTDNFKAIAATDDGEDAGVQLNSKGSVNIEVYNVAGGNPTIYTVNPRNWFFSSEPYRFDSANSECFLLGGRMPEFRDELSHGTGVRGVGSLYSEWGNVSSAFGTKPVWSGEFAFTHGAIIRVDFYYVVNLQTGDYDSTNEIDRGVSGTACVK